MNGLINENQLAIVKEPKFDEPPIHKTDSLIDNCFRDCPNKYFHTFEYKCVCKIKLTNFGNKDTVNLAISDKNMDLFELKKKSKIARQGGSIFNQINKLTTKNYSHQRYKNIWYYLKHQIPVMHRQFFNLLSQNLEYVKTHSNDMENLFRFAIRKWMIKQELDIDEN